MLEFDLQRLLPSVRLFVRCYFATALSNIIPSLQRTQPLLPHLRPLAAPPISRCTSDLPLHLPPRLPPRSCHCQFRELACYFRCFILPQNHGVRHGLATNKKHLKLLAQNDSSNQSRFFQSKNQTRLIDNPQI